MQGPYNWEGVISFLNSQHHSKQISQTPEYQQVAQERDLLAQRVRQLEEELNS
jgi:hypothetical protein